MQDELCIYNNVYHINFRATCKYCKTLNDKILLMVIFVDMW